MKQLVCIVCPRGCHLSVNESTLEVSGNFCPRGQEYAQNEIKCPMRTVTGSISIIGGIHARLAVRTDKPIPKKKVREVMEALHACGVSSPIHRGDIIIENVCGTGANVVATRDM